jgi:transcriptional regulator with PAS, ATPase and Fis domain
MIKWIFKYRIQILILLLFVEVIATLGAYYEDAKISRMYFYLETGSTFLIVAIAATFLDRLNLYLFLTSRQNYLQNIAPCCYIFYDIKKQKPIVPEYTATMLGLEQKLNYNLEDFQGLFSKHDWDELLQHLRKPDSYKGKEKTGIARCVNTNNEEVELKYSAQFISDKKYNINGMIFWFMDVTSSVDHETKIVKLIQKYRLMSFELDYLFNHIPIPVWRREYDGEIVFSNRVYKKVSKSFDSDANDNELEQGLKRLYELTLQDKKAAKITRSFSMNNKYKVYEFIEKPISENTGSVGFAIDVTNKDLLEKENHTLSQTIEKILDLSNSAIIIVDKKGDITRYNQKIIDLFGLVPTWLANKPSYSSFWDKLKEMNKLPDMKSYKEFKDKQLANMRQLLEVKSEFLHLPDGKTLGISLIPSQKNAIITFENITDVLKVERLYNQANSVFEATVYNLPNAVSIFGHNGRLRLFNQSFEKMLQIQGDLLKNMPHLSEIIANSNSDMKNIDDLRVGIINCLESRKNADLTLIDSEGNKHQTRVISLPDNSVLVTANFS